MRTRKATPADAPAIHALIAAYAAQGLLLPRSEDDVRAHIAGFRVLTDRERIAGCVALESYGPDLAEIRSLAVDAELHGRGRGSQLVQAALAEARRRQIARVFAVTQSPGFFTRQGFAAASRYSLPEKIARDCVTCPKAPRCALVAVIAVVCPERVALPVLAAADSTHAI